MCTTNNKQALPAIDSNAGNIQIHKIFTYILHTILLTCLSCSSSIGYCPAAYASSLRNTHYFRNIQSIRRGVDLGPYPAPLSSDRSVTESH